jgi:hypothetical protein
MAIVNQLTIPPELEVLWNQLFNVADNRVFGSIRQTGYLTSRQKVKNLTAKSLLPQLKQLRAGLSPAEVAAWKAAGAASNQNWWSLFVQDTSYRMKYGIAGIAPPSPLHQYKVGRIEIAAPATRVKLAQFHPVLYYVNKKVRGSTTLREDVAISEKFVLPLSLALSYRSNLVSVGSTPAAQFYAIIYSSYQGRTIETKVDIPLDSMSSWTRETVSCTDVIGVARYYTLYIEITDLNGWLEFDNIEAIHNGTNYARDKRCNDVNNTLTRTNFQIEKSWEEQYLPAGAAFDSVYPAD